MPHDEWVRHHTVLPSVRLRISASTCLLAAHLPAECATVDETDAAAICRQFLQWFCDHGGQKAKIDWPVSVTADGMRGAVALQDITTNEAMLTVPDKLLITPETALQSEIGHVFTPGAEQQLNGDDILTAFLMYEINKGEESFWWPYFATLPQPETIAEWEVEELEELQDSKLLMKAQRRQRQMRSHYHKIITDNLALHHPALCGQNGAGEAFSFKAYKFAWLTIQARAFGRRLPWSALVPFACALNHGNVQTKYKLQDGVFTLCPTGSNRYLAGSEVLNSYGRRSNAALLLDYGFAMLDNEWEQVELQVPGLSALSCETSLYPLLGDRARYQGAILQRLGLLRSWHSMHGRDFAWPLLSCFRVLHADDGWLREATGGNVDAARIQKGKSELFALKMMHEWLCHLLRTDFAEEPGDKLILKGWKVAEAAESHESSGLIERRDRYRSAVVYRVARRRILEKQLCWVQHVNSTVMGELCVPQDNLELDIAQRSGRAAYEQAWSSEAGSDHSVPQLQVDTLNKDLSAFSFSTQEDEERGVVRAVSGAKVIPDKSPFAIQRPSRLKVDG